MIDKSISLFLGDEECARVIVVLSEKDFSVPLAKEVIRVKGGKTRAESVHNGLEAAESAYVMVHDGARPFLKRESVELLKETLKEEDACFLAVKEKDSLKKVIDGYVVENIDRETIYHAQTPQAFKTELLKRCLQEVMEKQEAVTDDVQAVQLHSDTKIKAVNGDEGNYKLTVIEDLHR